MSSPTDDEDGAAEPVDPAATTPDPALSYPRGNRLGIRHPRPTVVIVVAVILLVGGAAAWRIVQRPTDEQLFCTLVGQVAQPIADTPEGAFDAWWEAGGSAEAQLLMARELGRPVDAPSRNDFDRLGDRQWMWRIDDTGISIGVGPADASSSAYGVIGVNPCGYPVPS